MKKTTPQKKFTERAGRRKRILMFSAACLFLAAVIFLLFLRFMPWSGLDSFLARQYSSRFYDREGELVYILALEEGLRREWTDIEKMPKELLQTFIQAEDKNFYKHSGVDSLALLRAVFQNAAAGKRVSGASTITMQLARMVKPRTSHPVKTTVKIKEIINAVRLELKLSKNSILELYMNSIPFGYQTEGVTSAARNFFNKTLSELSYREMEILSLIPRSPSAYSHLLGNTRSFSYPNKVPHFMQHLLSQTKDSRFENDVMLSINLRINEAALSEIRHKIREYEDSRISSGSAFVIDNKTGEILVWVGNENFEDPSTGYVDGVTAKNQSGSTMKPFLYALALERGFSPNSVLPDVPMDFGSEHIYVPQNFNNRYNGPQLFRTCLASSLNIPAVYLLYRIGVDSFFSKLTALGFNSLEAKRDQSGLSSALGSGEVTLFELVRAFSVFARDGMLPSLTYFKNRKTAYEENPVFTKDTARILCSMLSDNNARSLGFGYAKVFETPYPSIFKTGTANQFQDILALGSTPSYTAGVWMGSLSGETIISETGSSIPAHVVRLILDEFEKVETSPSAFKEPALFTKKKICALSGMRAGPLCRNTVEEYVLKGPDDALEVCSWHYKDKGIVSIRYPDEFQRWFSGRNMAGSLSAAAELRFLYPADGALYIYDAGAPETAQMLRVETAGGKGDEAELFDNGKSLGISARPFSWFIHLEPGSHILKAASAQEEAVIHITVR
ncbi:MAG TPA: transglycosylase domain-containing protein [Treponemataceae bacterium]|nr:transglycosylase domain-containing protein [Treponemataceae bacterium]